MPRRIRTVPGALAILGAVVALCIVPQAASATVTAKLRVLTPDRVLDPGTTYIVDDDIDRPDPPRRRLLRPARRHGGRSSATTSRTRSALLATAGRTTKSVAPARAHRPVRVRARRLRHRRRPGDRHSFWYLKSNHEEATVGADQLEVHDGDQVLYYLSPDNYPTRTRPSSSSRPRRGHRPGSRSRHRARTQVRDRSGSTVRDHLRHRARRRGHGLRGRRAGDHRRRRHSPADVASRSEAELGAARGADIPSQVSHLRRRHSSTTARRRAASAGRQPAARQDQGAPRATTRSAHAAATTGSTPARAAPT